MYDLTVADVHTFAVGDGEWVVHNEVCPIYRGTNEQYQIDAYKETGWVLSKRAIWNYQAARADGLGIQEALWRSLSETWDHHRNRVQAVGGITNAASGHAASSSDTFISFTVNKDVSMEDFHGDVFLVTIDQVEVANNQPWILDNRPEGNPGVGQPLEEEILVEVGIPWEGYGSVVEK